MLDVIIAMNKVSVYHEDHLILSDVSLQIETGELVYLIGRTASGKSSLLKTLYGELPLVEGEATVGEFALHDLSRNEIPYLRRKIGIVFQDFQLLTDRSVRENLLFVLHATGWKKKADIDARITEVLDKVDLRGREHKMPHQLSGGEQQRVVIARALLNDPHLILADEPTGNLDPETSDEIMNLLIKISKTGRAVLMATHNYSLLKKYPSRTIRCEQNKVTEVSDTENEIDFDSLML